jgi:hypothetical protein
MIILCAYIIRQYTIVYLKNTKLSTKEIRNCQQNEFPKKSLNTSDDTFLTFVGMHNFNFSQKCTISRNFKSKSGSC